MNQPSEKASDSPEEIPAGAFNVHLFQMFNAIAFQIILGAPIILYAKSLGASSTVLGVIAAFTPIMTVMQLPAARLLNRFSYREFVLFGWGLRTIFIFVVALIPLLGFFDAGAKLGMLLVVLFIFNLLRGISSGGFMPWITAIIPEKKRGKFLSRDQFFIFLGSLLALVLSAFVMTGPVDNWEYALVFLVSALGGSASLFFIKRIPDAPAGDAVRRSAHLVPWTAMLKYSPFFRLICFNVLFMFAIGGVGVFSVEYLREFPKFRPDLILYLSGVSFIGPLLSLLWTGSLIDQIGSKVVLRVSLCGFTLVLVGWWLMAANVIPSTIAMVAAINFLAGLSGANFNLANLRITMSTIPEMGRNHFFALFTVITSLGLGAAPIMWGVSLDAIGTYEFVSDWFVWRRHSIFFAALIPPMILVNFLVGTLQEPTGGKSVENLPHYAKLKRLARNWLR